MARWQKIQSPHKDDSAPVIFAAYVKSLKQYTPSFISSTASTSRSVTDAQTLLLVRGAAFAFLHDLLQHIQGSIASIQRLLAVVYEQHLYVPTLGHSDAWKQTLAQLLSLASVSTEKAHEQIRVDCMCLLMQIEPSLVEAKVDHLLPTLNLHHPHMRPLFDHLRNYFVRTRRLPDYVDLLIRTSAPASLPSFERTALARALSTSLQPSQSLSMCQKIVEQAMDFVLSGEAQQPPAKKLKKSRRSSTGTSTAPAQNLSLLEAATLVLEAVECPFVDQASLATTLSEALQRLMADEAHCGSESSLQMSAVYLGWMLRHAASMASRWSALNDTIDILAGQIQKTLESQNTSETTRYHAVSLLLV